MTLASIAVVAILAWLVYYTQRFMLTKRSRELGTYILLGVENRQVARMFAMENLLVGAAAFVLGLLGGNLLYQGLRAVILSLFGLPYTFRFFFSLAAIGLTALYFTAIFLLSTLLCMRRIKKISIRGLMEMERKNEEKIVSKKKNRRKMFAASVLCGIAGTALLLTREFSLGILGSALIILFCYGFFISFSSGVPAFFDKRPSKKYKGNTLLVFRSLSAKLASMGITMGTIAMIFTATLLSEGAGLLFQNQFNQYEQLITAFDLFIAAPAEKADMAVYEDYINENLEITSQRRYHTYNAADGTVTQYVKDHADYWIDFDQDQLMKASDYQALRSMLGYKPVKMEENDYIIHCMAHLRPVFEKYDAPLTTDSHSLTKGDIHTEVLTQFNWDGNGRGFILVVPDEAAASLTPSLEVWAMMTAKPLAGTVYQGIQNIRDDRINKSQDSSIYDTLYARSAVKEEYASMSALIVFPLFYLALVLIMTAATILTIQFLSEAGKYRQQFAILHSLGMDRKDIRRTLSTQLAIFYSMPVIAPVIICIVFMFSLGHAFDPGIVVSAAHLWSMIGFSLLLFFVIYLLYAAIASHSLKKTVLDSR